MLTEISQTLNSLNYYYFYSQWKHPVCAVHRGCAVHWGVFSTLEGYYEYTGDTMMSVGRYHEYSRGCSVHWRIPLVHTMMSVVHTLVHTIMSTPGDIQYTGVSIQFNCFPNDLSPTFIMISPSVLMISPSVLNIPRCTAHPPVYCIDIMQGAKLLDGFCPPVNWGTASNLSLSAWNSSNPLLVVLQMDF